MTLYIGRFREGPVASGFGRKLNRELEESVDSDEGFGGKSVGRQP